MVRKVSGSTIVSLLAIVVALAIVCPLLGRHLAHVFDGGPALGDRLLSPVERRLYRVMGTGADREQRWSAYAMSVLALSFATILGLYILLRSQGRLPFNPNHVPGMSPILAFNTAASS